jgi:hypothetical protein
MEHMLRIFVAIAVSSINSRIRIDYLKAPRAIRGCVIGKSFGLGCCAY